MAEPLYDLTKKDTPWNWSPECQQAFEKIKNNLTNPPLLAYPDNTKDYIIDCDASTNGLDHVLAKKLTILNALWHTREEHWKNLRKTTQYLN